MSIAGPIRRIAVIATIASLCALVAGCVSDMDAPTAEGLGTHQLRYYGGPKYPMWPNGQVAE
jgi:hypothetical protein